MEYPGEGYHVLNRRLVRQAIFWDLTNLETFLQVLGETHGLWSVETFAYSLIEDH